jgi:hypothetical protein
MNIKIRISGIVLITLLEMCYFNLKGQESYITFKNEYYGLSDGIHSFSLIEDPKLDSLSIIKADTSFLTGPRFYIETSTYATINKIIWGVNTDSNCIFKHDDSLIVTFTNMSEHNLKTKVVCYANAFDYFKQLQMLTINIKGISMLSDFFYSCALSMNDALDLRKINK